MPELPEVETLRMGLEKYLVGHTIEDVEIKVQKLFIGDKNKVIGAKITSIKRYGKGLVVELNNNFSLAIHIKLTGQLIYRDPSTKKEPLSTKAGNTLPTKFTHVIFKLDKNAVLYYNDVRKFGWIKVIRTNDLSSIPFFKDMGPEPPVAKIQKDRAVLTLDLFKQILSKVNVPVKVAIMDQRRIGGVGNIYANDSLFIARIDPRRKAKSLTEPEMKKLFEAIVDSLKKGLKYGGASELNFVDALGQDGGYQNHMLVYGKKGEPCPNCGEKIKRIELGGRGTFFCEVCQT